MVTWWGSAVECASAIERRAREGASPQVTSAAYRNLADLSPHWREVRASEPLRQAAMRLLRAHRLRAADAMHLAAALLASNFHPVGDRLLTQDRHLRSAAQREGFEVD